MNSNGLKSIFFVAPILCALLACSGGAGNDNGKDNAEQVKLQAAKDRVAEWGQLVGLDAATAESELTAAGLIGQVGTNAELNETEAQAFLELTFARDKAFAEGVEELNRRNHTAFLSFLAARARSSDFPSTQPSLNPTEANQTNSPPENEADGNQTGGFGGPNIDIGQVIEDLRNLRQTALNDYAAVSAQAFTLRQRILTGTSILGFALEPASMRDLLIDEGFTTIRNDFAAPVLLAIFARNINPDPLKEGVDFSLVGSEEQVQFSAEPLADVTFKVGPRFISFYQFNAFIASGVDTQNSDSIQANPGISLGGLNGAPTNSTPSTARGSFKVIPAADNFFPLRDLFLENVKK